MKEAVPTLPSSEADVSESDLSTAENLTLGHLVEVVRVLLRAVPPVNLWLTFC